MSNRNVSFNRAESMQTVLLSEISIFRKCRDPKNENKKMLKNLFRFYKAK